MIIAEIGINHGGSLSDALKMIEEAGNCGAKAVKFQGFKANEMYVANAPGFSHTSKDIVNELRKYEIKDDWWPLLKKKADENNLLFGISIFDDYSLNIIKEHKIKLDFVKIASGEVTNLPFIKKQISLSSKFIVSTGMANLKEIEELVNMLKNENIQDITLLECTSVYPAQSKNIYLLNIDFLKKHFNLPVGFSDHSKGYIQAIAAIARGAMVIEKHFCLEHSKGPDIPLSALPKDLKIIAQAAEEIKHSLKSNEKEFIQEAEKEGRLLGRKSWVSKKDIKKGEVLNETNTTFKRPGTGISPLKAEKKFGVKAVINIKKDTIINEDMIKG